MEHPARLIKRIDSGQTCHQCPKSTFIALATSPGTTGEDGQVKNGTYTGALLQHLRTKGISTFQLFSRVNGTVDEQTQGAQTPWMLSSFSDDLILTRVN